MELAWVGDACAICSGAGNRLRGPLAAMENLNFTFFNKWTKPSAAVGAGRHWLRAGALLRCSHLSGAGGAKQRFRAIETK